jgi:hypothetical protein
MTGRLAARRQIPIERDCHFGFFSLALWGPRDEDYLVVPTVSELMSCFFYSEYRFTDEW